jgi:hypothetical protein
MPLSWLLPSWFLYLGGTTRTRPAPRISSENIRVELLHGYFDESGTHSGSQAVSVAGYLSTAEGWATFEREWGDALKWYSLPQFHMTDFVARRPPYAGWSQDERESRLTHLIDIINRNVLAGIGFSLPTQEYYSTFSKAAKRYAGGLYGIAAISCFIDAAKAVEREHPDARVKFIFEQGVEGRGKVMKVFDQVCSNSDMRCGYRLHSLAYDSKARKVPFQAADILAYELHRYLPVMRGETTALPRSNALSALRRCPISYWKTFGSGMMAEFAIVVDTAARVYGPQGPKLKRRYE